MADALVHKRAAADSEGLTVALAGVEETFVTQTAPLIAQWNNDYTSAGTGQRTDQTNADNAFRSASAGANGNRRAADFAAQSTAFAGMNSRAPSAFLNSQANLADQRSSWWAGQQAAELSAVADRNTEFSNHTDDVNAAEIARAAAVNAAGVTYANTTAGAYRQFKQEIAAHLETYLVTVSSAKKTFGEVKASAQQTLDVALANAQRDLTVNDDNSVHAAAVSAAHAAYSNSVHPAADALRDATRLASETRAQDDAQSQRDINEAITAASKAYKDAVASTQADAEEASATAAETFAGAVAAIDSAIADLGDSTWSDRLGVPSNATSDPWFELASDAAIARADHSASESNALNSRNSDEASALHDLALNLAAAVETSLHERETIKATYTDSGSAASEAFTQTTGSGVVTPAAQSGFATILVTANGSIVDEGEMGGSVGAGADTATGEVQASLWAPVWLLLWWPWGEGEDYTSGPALANEPFDLENYGSAHTRKIRQHAADAAKRAAPLGTKTLVADFTRGSLALIEHNARRTHLATRAQQDANFLLGYYSESSLPYLTNPQNAAALYAMQQHLKKHGNRGNAFELAEDAAALLDELAIEATTAGFGHVFGSVFAAGRTASQNARRGFSSWLKGVLSQMDEVASASQVVTSFDDFIKGRDFFDDLGKFDLDEALKAFEVYKRASRSKGLILGTLDDTYKHAIDGWDILNTTNWSPEINRAWLDGAIDARKPIKFVGDSAEMGTLGNPSGDLQFTRWEIGYLFSRDYVFRGSRFVPVGN